jgi:hypothetical protein
LAERDAQLPAAALLNQESFADRKPDPDAPVIGTALFDTRPLWNVAAMRFHLGQGVRFLVPQPHIGWPGGACAQRNPFLDETLS